MLRYCLTLESVDDKPVGFYQGLLARLRAKYEVMMNDDPPREMVREWIIDYKKNAKVTPKKERMLGKRARANMD